MIFKNFIFFTLTILLTLSQASATENLISDLVKNSDGKILKSGWFRGKDICRIVKGGDLPTVRDYAEEATKYGAEILETYQVSKEKLPNDFVLVDVYNINVAHNVQKRDTFYYSFKSYNAPNGELGKTYAWTSSTYADAYENKMYWTKAIFSPHNGGFSLTHENEPYAVRCVDRIW